MHELTCSLVTYDDSVEWYPKTRCYGFLPKKNILFTSFICEIIMSLSIITRWGIGRIFDIIHFICKNVLSRYKQVQLHSNDTISWNRIHVWCKKVNLFSILSCISQKVTSMDKYLDECRRLMLTNISISCCSLLGTPMAPVVSKYRCSCAPVPIVPSTTWSLLEKPSVTSPRSFTTAPSIKDSSLRAS